MMFQSKDTALRYILHSHPNSIRQHTHN